VLRKILRITIIYKARNLPKYRTILFGRTRVGKAKIKTITIPRYKKMLNNNDLINCIKNLLI